MFSGEAVSYLHEFKSLLKEMSELMVPEKDVEKVISLHRPPIFWKDKPIIKKQLQLWTQKNIKELSSL